MKYKTSIDLLATILHCNHNVTVVVYPSTSLGSMMPQNTTGEDHINQLCFNLIQNNYRISKGNQSILYYPPGCGSIAAVRNDRIHELDPSIILQPGHASLTDGLNVIQSLME